GVFRTAVNRPYEMRRAEAQGDAAAEVLANLKREAEEYLRHPAEWYRFRKDLLIYNTITDTWVSESQSPLLARAGAGLVTLAPGRWLLIGGEEKPGVRAADVNEVTMGVRTDFGRLNWAVLAAYLIGMVLLGYYFMRREGGAGDFFTGGGRVPWWAAGMSIYATMLSAITYMAYPAKAFATDWTYYPMLVTILLVSFPVIRYYLPFFRRLNVTSAYEYLERRFNAATRLMASALFIVFMVARMALVLYLPSLALTAVTGIDIYVCIVLMGCVTIVYCTMGGVEAVVWGDVVQGFILVGGAVLAAGFLIFGTEGGFEGFLAIGSEAGKFRLFDWSFDYRSATFWVIILGGMANNLISYTSDQTVIQRYLTTKDERSARQSILMNGAMSVGVSIVFFVIGAGLYTFYKTNPAAMDFTMQKADVIFPFFMMSQLPAGVAGLLIAAVFAATMSTISSNINSVATAFSIDFYKRRRPQTGDKEMLRVARRACVAAGVIGMTIALLMATWEILSLLDFFQEILGLLSGGLGGLFLMGIFVPRIGGKAALTGFVCGVTAVFVTKYCTEASFLLYGFISMLVSVLTALLASYVFKEPRGGKGLTWKTLE
ncbi:MAG: sodium:solute symporter family transporter, partial [Bacteroidales bacterium]